MGRFRDALDISPYVNHDALRTREGENTVSDVIRVRDINYESQTVLARLAEPEPGYDVCFRRKFRDFSAPFEASARDVNKNSRGLLQGARFEIKRFAVQYEDYPRITRCREFSNPDNAGTRPLRAASTSLILRPENDQQNEREKQIPRQPLCLFSPARCGEQVSDHRNFSRGGRRIGCEEF